MRGMYLIIPPTCDVTVPPLGAYQLAGFAAKCNYPLVVRDFNTAFCKNIVNFAVGQAAKSCANSCILEEQMEAEAAAAFIRTFPELNGYDSLLANFRSCVDTSRYWKLVDYLRACYDLFSLQFDNLRFRIDGLDCECQWNIWPDIEVFLAEYSEGTLADSLFSLVGSELFSEFDTVGLSVTFESQLFLSLIICTIIRKINPRLKIVLGGGFINNFVDTDEAMGPIADYCDCVFSGEGEALIKYLADGNTDLHIHGKKADRNKACFITPKDICDERLQVCPPRFSDENLNCYLSPKRIVPLRFSYDCYWGKCNFCSDKEHHECLEKEYDIQSMNDYCLREISENRVDGIYFLDSAIRPRDVKSFASALVEAGLSIPWGSNLRFEAAFDDEELIELMAKSGFVFAKFGLESGSQRILDLMCKGICVNIAANIIEKLRRHNIFVHTYIMVAYPGETFEDRKMTEEFLLSEFSHPDNYNCSEFILYGNAGIAKEYGDRLKLNFEGKTGWCSSEFSSFSNDDIKMYISDLRKKFEAKFMPRSILMSTGHTIAYNEQLSNSRFHSTSSRYVSLSKKVLYLYVEGVPCLLWWRRNRGCSFIRGDWATFLYSVFYQGLSIENLDDIEMPQQFVDALWNETCIVSNERESVFFYGASNIPNIQEVPGIISRSKFDKIKWYGFSDAD